MEQDQSGGATSPDSGWQFKNEGTSIESDVSRANIGGQNSIEPVQWTASEYIAHPKNMGWYLMLLLGTSVLAALAYFFTHDFTSPVIIVIVAIIFGVFGARNPQMLNYTVDANGIHIGHKSYPYESFKSFSVVQEGAIASILLIPLKRFMPPISIYFAPNDGHKIVSALGDFLPHEDRSPDVIDSLMRKIRF